jgi:hypothetical protein
VRTIRYASTTPRDTEISVDPAANVSELRPVSQTSSRPKASEKNLRVNPFWSKKVPQIR